MVADKDILFSNIFEKALREWPDEIEFGSLLYNDGSGYMVENMNSNTMWAIESKGIGEEDEVFIRNMHQAIYIVLHKIAYFCIAFQKSQIRRDTVKKTFDEMLNDAVKIKSLGWTDSDYELIERYFTLNSKTNV